MEIPAARRGAPRTDGGLTVRHGSAAALAALDQLPDLLTALAADLLVERVAALVPDGDAALAARLRHGHAATPLLGLLALRARALLLAVRHVPPLSCAPPRATAPLSSFAAVVVAGARLSLRSARLALLDELADLVPALAADLLVEGRAPLRLDGLAALLPDLLVEAGAALGLDGVAALLADLLVELAAPLGLHGLAALLADLLVELAAPRLADPHAALATGLRDRHRPLATALLLVSHGSPPCSSRAQCGRCTYGGAGPGRARARR